MNNRKNKPVKSAKHTRRYGIGVLRQKGNRQCFTLTRCKKVRGWKNKEKLASAPKAVRVQVSGITEKGFWLHTPIKDYYLSRADFPWFRDAADHEIRDVTLTRLGENYHGDMLYWKLLDVDFTVNAIETTDWIISTPIYVRGFRRCDLDRSV